MNTYKYVYTSTFIYIYIGTYQTISDGAVFQRVRSTLSTHTHIYRQLCKFTCCQSNDVFLDLMKNVWQRFGYSIYCKVRGDLSTRESCQIRAILQISPRNWSRVHRCHHCHAPSIHVKCAWDSICIDWCNMYQYIHIVSCAFNTYCHVHSMHIECAYNAHWMRTQHTMNAHEIPSMCTFNRAFVLSGCVSTCVACSSNGHWMRI